MPKPEDRMRALAERGTQGRLQVQDGCSWRRIGHMRLDGYSDGGFLRPIRYWRDGHPDLDADDGHRDDNLSRIAYTAEAERMRLVADVIEVARIVDADGTSTRNRLDLRAAIERLDAYDKERGDE